METVPEGCKRNWEHTVLHPALGATSGAQSITCVLIPPPQAAMGQAASSQWGTVSGSFLCWEPIPSPSWTQGWHSTYVSGQ